MCKDDVYINQNVFAKCDTYMIRKNIIVPPKNLGTLVPPTCLQIRPIHVCIFTLLYWILTYYMYQQISCRVTHNCSNSQHNLAAQAHSLHVHVGIQFHDTPPSVHAIKCQRKHSIGPMYWISNPIRPHKTINATNLAPRSLLVAFLSRWAT